MGQGRDMARAADPDAPHHDLLENFRDQLLVALLARLGGKDGRFEIPVAEVDATGDKLVSFAIQETPAGKAFLFVVSKKQ